MTGLKENDQWLVRKDDHTYKSFSLKDSFSYLNSKIHDDGSFGTDFWDACRLAKLIATFDLKDHFPSYEKLHKSILKCINEDSILAGSSEWRGSGFLAAAIDYLNSIDMKNTSEKLIDVLLRS
ncbi:MAG: hypothetical protein QW751_01390 [Candidatus Aenigmatarchaeota archaeon]